MSELTALGAIDAKEQGGGVRFSGDLAVAYRACLWSRLASRILLPLGKFPLTDAQALYDGARAIDWPGVFELKRTFAIEVAGHSPAVTHTHYAGLKVKDAIADAFREATGERPNVDTDRAQISVHLHMDREHATISLDLSGESLHKRGYRRGGSAAPLKENLAATILTRAGWPQFAAQGAPLLDPLCGSGTLLIEAALMAADVAPGLSRERYGFEAWRGHQAAVWQEILADARARSITGRKAVPPPMRGQDADPMAIEAARENAVRAGVADRIVFEAADLSDARPQNGTPGLIVTNPPYGERLGSEGEVIKIHSLLGATLKAHFPGWRAAVFTGRPDLGHRIGLRAEKMWALYNGPLECKLLLFEVHGARPAPAPAAQPESGSEPCRDPTPIPVAAPAGKIEGGEDFANRLKKNLKHLGKWAKREGITCYRAYDADLPDYAVAVDIYESAERHLHVQEYAAPKTVEPARAERRLREALAHTQQILEVPASRLHYKLRYAQKRGAQYARLAESGKFIEIDEQGVKLRVNLDDFLDSGLFLDHRPLRRRIRTEARGKSFLNLFSYTGSATAHAIHGGATRTLSVDMSNTYLDWASRNLALNGVRAVTFDYPPAPRRPGEPPNWPAHALLRADCLKWLDDPETRRARMQYDLILCDPPTFSHSKKMEGVLDIQRDHAALIRQCANLLAPGGTLYFSTNRRGFKLDAALAQEMAVDDITAKTLDEDFSRPRPAHKCWQIRNLAA